MKKEFKRIRDIKIHVHQVLAEIIVNEIEPLVKEWIQEAIDEHVYSTYIPKTYVRRRDDGMGLRNIENMESFTLENAHVKGVLERVIRHLAEADHMPGLSPGEFSKKIQEEEGFAGDPAEGAPPRHYMIHVINRIQTDKEVIYRILEQGLKAHGLRVERRV